MTAEPALERSVWSDIYRGNVWNGTESRSGPGSGTAATRRLVPALLELVSRRDIRTVLDVACGDGFWMPELPGYVGIDVAPEALALARARHPHRRYVLADVRDLAPVLAADLVILRDVVQHHELESTRELVEAALLAGRWLLASSYRDGSNTGISEAEARRALAFDNDLTAPPFGLGPAVEELEDGFAYHGDEVRDARKYLGLWPGYR